MDNYCHIVVDHARDEWKEIGRRLGLSETEISAIDEEERGNTTEGCRKVLNKWRQMYGQNATVDVLKQAFIDLERRDVVDLLEQADIHEADEGMHEAARRKAELRHSGPSLFIIHAGEDKEPFVRPLYKALLDQNLPEEEIFFDEVSISPGENISDKIMSTLESESLKLVTIVVSNHLIDKYWPRLEYELSLFHQKKFHPIWLDQNTDNFEAFSRKVGSRFPMLKKTLAHRIQYDNIAEKVTDVAVKIVQLLSVLKHESSETKRSKLTSSAAASPMEDVTSGTETEQENITKGGAEREAEHQESAMPALLYPDIDAPGEHDQPPPSPVAASAVPTESGSSENRLKELKIKRLKKRTKDELKMLGRAKRFMSKKEVERKCKEYLRRFERDYARIQGVRDGCLLMYLTFDLVGYLREFWDDYTSGALSTELTEVLVTDEMRAVVGQDVFVRVIILERDYRRWERYLERKGEAADPQKPDIRSSRSSVSVHTTQAATTPLHRLIFKISQELTDKDVQTVKDKIRMDRGEDKMAPYDNLSNLTEIFKQLEADNYLGYDVDEKVTNALKMFDGLENFDRRHFEMDIENAKENIDFVGREKDMDNLKNRITEGDYGHVKIIWINGFPGVGKTTFAHHLCLQMEQRRREIFISLAKVTSVDNMLTLIMREFGVTEINGDGNTQVEATVAHLIGTRDGEDCSLVLDDADSLLEAAESRRRFVGFLAKVQDKQNPKVHVIVTSRSSVMSGTGLGDVPSLEATIVNLEELADHDGTDLVRRLAGKSNITKEEAREVCKRCKGWPLAIRIACGAIRKDHMRPAEMIKQLENLTEIGDIRGFLTDVVRTLSRDLLATLKLVSVFAGPFTVESACIISGKPDQLYQVWGHLRELKTRSLVKAGSHRLHSTDGAPRYDTHDVVRNFVSTFDSDVVTVQEMAASKYRFQKLYEERLTAVAQNMQGNIRNALASYTRDVDNFNHFLSLIQKETQDDYEWRRKERDDSHTWLMDVQAEEVADRSAVHILLEQMMVVNERIAFYTGQAERSEKQNTQIYAEMLCWLAETYLQVNMHQEAWDRLEEARKALEARPDRGDDSVQLSFARYHYVSGIYFSLRDDYKRNVRQLDQALEILSKVKIAGNHVLHARVMNSLGFAHHNHAKNMWRGPAYLEMLQNSLKMHQKAYDIITSAVGEDNHFDCATYLMNIGVVNLDIGWQFSNAKEANQYFRKALETFCTAEELAKAMKLEKQHNSGLLQYNIARCHEALKEPDEAISRVRRAQKILESIYDSHPDIADCLYFLGKLSKDNGDPTSAMKYYKQSLEHTEDLGDRRTEYEWKRLKEAIMVICEEQVWDCQPYIQQFEKIDGSPYVPSMSTRLTGFGRRMLYRIVRPLYTFISDVWKPKP